MRALEKHILWVSLPLAIMGLLIWLYYLNPHFPIPAVIIHVNSTGVQFGHSCYHVFNETLTYACFGSDPNVMYRAMSLIGFLMLVGFGFVSLVMLFSSTPTPKEWEDGHV